MSFQRGCVRLGSVRTRLKSINHCVLIRKYTLRRNRDFLSINEMCLQLRTKKKIIKIIAMNQNMNEAFL